jgi:NADH dehydrogenase FAD-containing subunit
MSVTALLLSRLQEAAHMVQQIERQLGGKPLLRYTYRDFGSLVSLGSYGTVGNWPVKPARPSRPIFASRKI